MRQQWVCQTPVRSAALPLLKDCAREPDPAAASPLPLTLAEEVRSYE